MLGDPELTRRIDLIKMDVTDQELMNALLKTVLTRYTGLQKIAFSFKDKNS
jgi:hypothetical protein